MTTNRVKSIDAAIQSRIQLAIQYHDLDLHQRLAIYKNRLKYIPDDEIEDREELIKSLTTSPLIRIKPKNEKPNGRQIRNIVTYARALAKSEKDEKGNKRLLTLDHLMRVAEMTTTFTESMKELMQRQRLTNELEYEAQR
jgi:hypothetical protein